MAWAILAWPIVATLVVISSLLPLRSLGTAAAEGSSHLERPPIALLTQEPIVDSYGPGDCISVSRFEKGTCKLTTNCTGYNVSYVELCFVCINPGANVPFSLHSWGVGNFTLEDTFDSGVICDTCASIRTAFAPDGPIMQSTMANWDFPAADIPAERLSAADIPEEDGMMQPPVGANENPICMKAYRSDSGTCIVKVSSAKGCENATMGVRCEDAFGNKSTYMFAQDSLEPGETFDTRIRCSQCEAVSSSPILRALSSALPEKFAEDLMALKEEVSALREQVRTIREAMARAAMDPVFEDRGRESKPLETFIDEDEPIIVGDSGDSVLVEPKPRGPGEKIFPGPPSVTKRGPLRRPSSMLSSKRRPSSPPAAVDQDFLALKEEVSALREQVRAISEAMGAVAVDPSSESKPLETFIDEDEPVIVGDSGDSVEVGSRPMRPGERTYPGPPSVTIKEPPRRRESSSVLASKRQPSPSAALDQARRTLTDLLEDAESVKDKDIFSMASMSVQGHRIHPSFKVVRHDPPGKYHVADKFSEILAETATAAETSE